MPLDWSRVGASNQAPQLLPRDIFAALPSRHWSYLRQEQCEVLEKWFARREDRDIVIKQNTGGGKTAVGWLIAQSTLNEGIGKAVYLAPDLPRCPSPGRGNASLAWLLSATLTTRPSMPSKRFW
jgi:hypothetical protein